MLLSVNPEAHDSLGCYGHFTTAAVGRGESSGKPVYPFTTQTEQCPLPLSPKDAKAMLAEAPKASFKTRCSDPPAHPAYRGGAWSVPQPGEGAAPLPEEPTVVEI